MPKPVLRPPPPDPPRVGARFKHRYWREGGKDDGAPVLCEVVDVGGGEVRFRRFGRRGVLTREVYRYYRGEFATQHLGEWRKGPPVG